MPQVKQVIPCSASGPTSLAVLDGSSSLETLGCTSLSRDAADGVEGIELSMKSSESAYSDPSLAIHVCLWSHMYCYLQGILMLANLQGVLQRYYTLTRLSDRPFRV